MLEGFNPPYENETWYSALARYAHRTKLRRSIIKRKIGSSDSSMLRLDFPRGLCTMEQQLHPALGLSAERILQDHTVLPVYLPFLDDKARERLLSAVHVRAGSAIYPDSLRVKWKAFRYCPLCVEEDRRRYGEAYWHREHQLNWVGVCGHHWVFLESYLERTWPHCFHEGFVIAQKAIRPTGKVREVNLLNPQHRLCVDIAKDMGWLLSYRGASLALETLNQRYRWFAARRRLTTYEDTLAGDPWIAKLDDFFESYANALMEEAEEQGNDHCNPHIELCRNSKHPGYHLLIARYFKQTIQSIARLSEVPQLFGKGPWPCWNTKASHYGELVITECTIKQASKKDSQIGTFVCSCGFSYSRSGHDRSLAAS